MYLKMYWDNDHLYAMLFFTNICSLLHDDNYEVILPQYMLCVCLFLPIQRNVVQSVTVLLC